jgi:hypothetical protein
MSSRRLKGPRRMLHSSDSRPDYQTRDPVSLKWLLRKMRKGRARGSMQSASEDKVANAAKPMLAYAGPGRTSSEKSSIQIMLGMSRTFY